MSLMLNPGGSPVNAAPVNSWTVGGPDPSNADAPSYLTPDALMAYCQARLSNLDSQVQKLMGAQQNLGTEQQKIQDILKEVADLQTQCAGQPSVVSPADGGLKLEQQLEDAIAWMEQNDPTNPQIADLKNVHDTLMATGTGAFSHSAPNSGYYGSGDGKGPTGHTPPSNVRIDGDGTFGSDELQNATDTLKGISNSLSSGAEMGMIDIQSVMSQRSTAIQLVTNILQSYNDGLSKIADNVGH